MVPEYSSTMNDRNSTTTIRPPKKGCGDTARIRGCIVLAIVGAGLLCGLWCGSRSTWTPQRIERSKQIGDEILQAIAAFHEDRGRCPRKLEELVPDYIVRIEPPAAGQGRWIYESYDGGRSCSLALGVGQDCYPCCFFTWPESSDWVLDD